MNKSIIKTYDIRGVYPSEINEETAYQLGLVFVNFIKTKKVVVGYDIRLSSLSLFKSLSRGLIEAGADVLNIGLVSTDALYFASGSWNLPAIMITASHNPKEYNGFKLRAAGAQTITPQSLSWNLDKIKRSKKKGKIIKKDIFDAYRHHILSFVNLQKIKPLKIVIDAGNGLAAKMTPIIFKNLPCRIIPFNFALSGLFPHHSPNPTESKNTKDLQQMVVKHKAALGLAFDGDADRVFFINEKGERVSASFIICLIVKNLLSKTKNPRQEKIVYSLNCSQIIKETIEKYGAQALMERVGYVFIQQRMRKTNAIFGGEYSGHYYFRDNFFVDSGFLAALIVLEIISQENKPFSDILKEFKKYYALEEINIPVMTNQKEKAIKILEKKYRDAQISHLDGLTVKYDDWWFNLRPSNTEPLLRLTLEAVNRQIAEAKKKEVIELIRCS